MTLRYICLIILLTINNSCSNNGLFESPLRPDMLVENFTLTHYQEGILSWELDAKESSYYNDENRSIAKDIKLNYYKDDKVSAVVKANTAIIHSDTNDIDLIGNVDMLSTAGNRLFTKKITWNNKAKLLDTDYHVKIVKKNGDIIKGDGLRANYDLEDYEIKHNVVAVTKNVKDDKSKKK